jgi:peroxiredoxin
MRTHLLISAWLLLTAAIGISGPCLAQLVEVTKQQLKIMNQKAPDFTGTGSDGERIRLGDFAGKTVVLEWTNADCPYVRKWYASGAMQRLQSEAAAKGVVWLTVISPVRDTRSQAVATQPDSNAAHLMLDPTGTIGRLYGAIRMPYVAVVRPDGTVAYTGAIEGSLNDKTGAQPYAKLAINAVAAGRSPVNSMTQAFGCRIRTSP